MYPEKSDFIRKTIRGFYFAGKGLRYFMNTTSNALLHCMAALIACGLGWYLGISRMEWLAVILAISGVLVTEIINTAIELLVDLVSPEFNEKAGKVKDVAAGAVLIASISAACIGALIFIPRLVLLI
ncbi:MAG TPA: diacylglycerol kinase family protein [Bacteroidia bacterium]|jgi:diacylglycerol kinase|nr:diacylglycerol kinase family protein [Bacteroidia bacterium]